MPIPIILPKFGFTLESADIVRWLKQDGDFVRGGDPICEVTTDKVNMEVEAPEDGMLIQPLYPEGATVPVTEIIAYLLRPGEARPQTLAAKPGEPHTPDAVKPADSAPSVSSRMASPIAQRIAAAQRVDLDSVPGTGPNRRIMRRDVESVLTGTADKARAVPAARRLAARSDIDLATVTGSGPRGRIQSRDVEALIQARQTADALISQPAQKSAAAPQVIRLEGMRRTIAARLQKSYQTAPHIFLDRQVDASALEGLRQALAARGDKLSVTSVLVKACAWTLLRHPWLNATIDGEEVALWPTANIGVAVALEKGLVVPVVHQAERKGLREIQAQVDLLAERAKANRLSITDMIDGTFTISNLGMYGVDRFTAIINPPQVAILAVGRISRQFVPDDELQPVVRPLMNLTLSADHRVVDGAQAAQFLQDLRAALEQPAMLAW